MLVADGWRVVAASRRYAPIPAEPDCAGHHRRGERALWVAADWSNPDDLAGRAGKVLGGEADLLVAWVRGEHRVPVLHAVAPILAPDAPVVEVYSSGAADLVRGCPEPTLPQHPTQQVVLGSVYRGDGARWLTHEEISAGVLEAMRRALFGKPPAVHQIGERPSPLLR